MAGTVREMNYQSVGAYFRFMAAYSLAMAADYVLVLPATIIPAPARIITALMMGEILSLCCV